MPFKMALLTSMEFLGSQPPALVLVTVAESAAHMIRRFTGVMMYVSMFIRRIAVIVSGLTLQIRRPRLLAFQDSQRLPLVHWLFLIIARTWAQVSTAKFLRNTSRTGILLFGETTVESGLLISLTIGRNISIQRCGESAL